MVTSDQTLALAALPKAWAEPLHHIPAFEWSSRVDSRVRRRFEFHHALIHGIILEMWDSIARDSKRGASSSAHVEADALRQTSHERASRLLEFLRKLNAGSIKTTVCGTHIRAMIGPASEDAFTAFEWTAPDGVVDKEELDIARLQQSTKDVRTLNDMLDHSSADGTKCHKKIQRIIAASEAYTAPGTERTSALTLSHQFKINFARFMTTHENHNSLPGHSLPPSLATIMMHLE